VPQLGDLNFSFAELDCYKLAGYMFVCNATLEDTFINLGAHIQEQMVKGFKKAFDRAILKGTGATGKQLTGIIPNLPVGNLLVSSSDIGDIMVLYGQLPEEYTVTAAVMTKKTYVKHFLKQTLQVNSKGVLVIGSTANPSLPDGTPVKYVKNSIMDDDKMLVGDFGQYLLAQRKGMTMATTTEVKWIEEQTGFKIVGRYDGRPLKADAWLLIDLEEA
jgi:HK97 family phage major capsid protein